MTVKWSMDSNYALPYLDGWVVKGQRMKFNWVSIWKPWWWLGNEKKRLLLFTVYGGNGLIFSVDYNSNDWLWLLFVCFFSCPTYYERKVLGKGLFDERKWWFFFFKLDARFLENRLPTWNWCHYSFLRYSLYIVNW